MRMFIDAGTEEIPLLDRLILIKVDPIFLSKRILRSLRLVHEYFSLRKKLIPPRVLFVSSKQKT